MFGINCVVCKKTIKERTWHLLVFTLEDPIIVCHTCWKAGKYCPKGEFNIFRSCRHCGEMFFTRFPDVKLCSQSCSLEYKAILAHKTAKNFQCVSYPSKKIFSA